MDTSRLPALFQALALCASTCATSAAAATPPDYGPRPAGFYQIVAHGDEVFAAFGGTLAEHGATPPPPPAGSTPGAVFVFDATTLQLKQEIPLQAAAGALALHPATNRLVVGHTHHQAISSIDLATRQARYHPLDTQHDGLPYRIRYIATDRHGNLYTSAYLSQLPVQSAIFKFNAQGQRDPQFQVQPFGEFSLPVFISDRFSSDGQEQLLYGNAVLRAANLDTGTVEYTSSTPVRSSASAWSNFYTYSDGPGNSLIAANHPSFIGGNEGEHNLYLFEPGRESQPQAIHTGSTALEALYNPAAGQLYATSIGSKVLSIVALDGHARLHQAHFENLRIGPGAPNSLALRSTAQHTDLFVTLRLPVNQIARVRLAHGLQGVQGLRAPGACSVTLWDLEQRQPGAPQPCTFVDIEQQLEDNLNSASRFAHRAPEQLAAAGQRLSQSRAALAQARQQLKSDASDTAAQAAYQQAQRALVLSEITHEAIRLSAAHAPQAVAGAQRFLQAWLDAQR